MKKILLAFLVFSFWYLAFGAPPVLARRCTTNWCNVPIQCNQGDCRGGDGQCVDAFGQCVGSSGYLGDIGGGCYCCTAWKSYQTCCDDNNWYNISGCSASCGPGSLTQRNGCGDTRSVSCNNGACPTATPTPTPTPTPNPSCQTCYFSLSTTNADPGVVSTGRILGFLGNISSKMSVPKWQVAHESENLPAPIYDYNYFYQKLGSPSNNNFIGILPQAPSPLPASELYYFSGAVTTSGNWNIEANRKITILVNGDLTIGKEISVPVGSFLGFIVSGDITIDPNLGNNPASAPQRNNPTIEGVFFANGSFNLGAGVGGHEKFVGRGIFIAYNGFNLQRTLGANDRFYPAESFEYRPDFLVNFPGQMGVRKISWKEVAP